MNDWELLNQYVHKRSEDAFARLVELHAGMVYSVCRRRLHDGHLAEDATQAVFIVLAARARSLKAGTLAGWLYQTARHVADRVARHEETRLRHEREAAERQEMTSASPDDSHEAAEQVEHMLARLGVADRSAIVLRFLEDRSMIEIAKAMDLSEEAAKKRVARGLDRLKKLAASSGVPAAFPAIEVTLKTLNASAPPSDIAAKSIAVAIGKAKAIQSTIFAKEVIKMMILKKLQLVTLTVLSVFVVTGSTALIITKTGDLSAVAAAPPAPPVTAAPAKAAPPRPPVNARNSMNRVLPAAVFDNVGLADVFDFLKDISGVPINVDWKALDDAGVGKNAPSTVNLRDVTFATALRVTLWSVAEPGKLEYAVRDDHIDISTAAALSLPKAPDQSATNEKVMKNWNRNTVPDMQKFNSSIMYISQLTMCPVWVDWASLKKVGVLPNAHVDPIRLAGMTLPAALNTLLGEAGPKANLRWGYREGMIVVTTESELARLKALPYVTHDPR